MRLEYQLEQAWPVQAWLAECGPDRVVVRHGSRVETRGQWFCEAAWDGPFGEGGFDRTDIVAGSGGRLRDGAVTFVPTGATTDRLQSIAQPDGRTLVSNSLPCLLCAAGARVSPTYRHYRRDLQSIVKGLKKYKKTLDTSRGPCRLWYYHNVWWDGRALSLAEKPFPHRDFSTFEKYHAFLNESLAAVSANAGDSARAHSLGLVGTMSSGYDSTTVSALGRDHGLKDIITFDEARGGDPDSGVEAARHLGLRATVVRRDGWRDAPDRFPEAAFLAADGYGEDRFFLAAREHVRGKLVLTGFHGDKIWSKSPYKKDSLVPHPEIKRGDCSGLTMTEFRLSAGFIACPVPFWGARQIHDVVAISRDPSMRPWDVPGDYSRPICRRIVETAGVPRDVFGLRKRAGSLNERALVEASRVDYLAWCRRHGIEGALFDKIVRRSLQPLPEAVRTRVYQMFYNPRTPQFRDFYFAWALERRAEAYRSTAAPAAVAYPRFPSSSTRPAADAMGAGQRVAVAL